MSFDTIFEGTSVGVAASAAFSVAVPAVPATAPQAGAVAEPGQKSEASAEGRFEIGAGVWVECHERSGVTSIHDPRLFRPGRETFCRALAETAVATFQARRVEICLTSGMCRLEFRPGEFGRAELARRVAGAVTAATPAIGDGAGPPHAARANWTALTALATDAGISIRQDRPAKALLHMAALAKALTEAASAPRVSDLALAGGSLTMAVAGAILPGIPALPFLLLAARHAVRLSPRINHLLECLMS